MERDFAAMTPIQQIQKLYAGRSDMDFELELEAHFDCGYVVSTPKVFAMARPVRSDWSAEKLRNPFLVEPLETADCWFIWALAGDLAVAARWLPCELPLLVFARRGKAAKFVTASSLLNKALAKSK
jgi:hypothetical protein